MKCLILKLFVFTSLILSSLSVSLHSGPDYNVLTLPIIPRSDVLKGEQLSRESLNRIHIKLKKEILRSLLSGMRHS